MSILVFPNDGFSGQQEKAREMLRKLKEMWGVTWPEMGKFLGYPASTLRVYASNANLTIPTNLIGILLQLENAPGPSPDLDLRNSSVAIVVVNNKVYTIPVELRTCRFCGKPFAPEHPQQEYCDTYSGDCGLAMRRQRYKEGNRER